MGGTWVSHVSFYWSEELPVRRAARAWIGSAGRGAAQLEKRPKGWG